MERDSKLFGPNLRRQWRKVLFQTWRFQPSWHLLCCWFGAQVPHEVDSVANHLTSIPQNICLSSWLWFDTLLSKVTILVILILLLRLLCHFAQVHLPVLHSNWPHCGHLMDFFPPPLNILSCKVFTRSFYLFYFSFHDFFPSRIMQGFFPNLSPAFDLKFQHFSPPTI